MRFDDDDDVEDADAAVGFFILLEDGASHLLLEDNASKLLEEGAP